jgi:hypothetical protein
VVAVAVQNVFHLEIYQNDFFLFLKKLFLRSAHQNNLKTQKNNFNHVPKHTLSNEMKKQSISSWEKTIWVNWVNLLNLK